MSKVLEALAEGRVDDVNEALAVLVYGGEVRPCHLPKETCNQRHLYHPNGIFMADIPDFLAGLLPNGSCDEAFVDGGLLWRVMRAIKKRGHGIGLVPGPNDRWAAQAWTPDGWREEELHEHPVVALALVAEALGLLEGLR